MNKTKQDNVPQGKITSGAQFYYLGGLFTIGHISEQDDIIYIKDDKGSVSDMSLSLFKSEIQNGSYVMNVPQVKTVEGDTPLSEIMFKYINQKPKDFGNGMTERCFPVTAIVDIVTEHEAPLKSRIAELEAENATLREALEDIKLYASHDDNDQYGIYEEKAEQALKGKEVKGE